MLEARLLCPLPNMVARAAEGMITFRRIGALADRSAAAAAAVVALVRLRPRHLSLVPPVVPLVRRLAVPAALLVRMVLLRLLVRQGSTPRTSGCFLAVAVAVVAVPFPTT